MRKTIAGLTNGVYQYDGHADLSDNGARRYHPFSFDFDSSPIGLKEPEDHWEDHIKEQHIENRRQSIEWLKLEHGSNHIDDVVKDTADLGPKSFSMLTHHNSLHEQARRAFVKGLYYPALVAACALGERIFNHLLHDLRDSFKTSRHYKDVYREDSFDNWPYAIKVLTDWKVLADGVGDEFLALGQLRNTSIHFNPNTYHSLREDALSALQRLNSIIAKQFGYFGSQPWFIEGTSGTQFIRRDYECHPFVRIYIIPRSGFIGPLYSMERSPDGYWRHLDYADYGDQILTDEDFAKAYRERDPERVVSREMIQRQSKGAE